MAMGEKLTQSLATLDTALLRRQFMDRVPLSGSAFRRVGISPMIFDDEELYNEANSSTGYGAQLLTQQLILFVRHIDAIHDDFTVHNFEPLYMRPAPPLFENSEDEVCYPHNLHTTKHT